MTVRMFANLISKIKSIKATKHEKTQVPIMPQSHFRKNRLSKGLLHGRTSFRSDILTRKHGEDSYYTFVERN